jgi:polyhydroxybutyrate depolymerase
MTFGRFAALASLVVFVALVLAYTYPGGQATPARASLEPLSERQVAASPPSSGNATSAVAVAAKGSAGCGKKDKSGAQPGSTIAKQMTVGGVRRDYRVHVGAAAVDGKPMAVVLNYHGRGSTGSDMELFSGMVPVSDREGFLVVSPDGTGVPRGWSAGASMPGWTVDDVAFSRELIKTLKADYCLDPARVYVEGHSNGAFMVSRLACAMGNDIAAVAPVSGVYLPGDVCGPPVPVLAIHGTADEVVPYSGGKVRGSYPYRGAEKEMAAVAARNGCSAVPYYEEISAHVLLETRSGCTQPAMMLLIDGGNHAWPAQAGTPLASELKTADLIWAFFKDKRSAATE